jgi:hypothetical protein
MAEQYDDATLRKLLADNGVDWDEKIGKVAQQRPEAFAGEVTFGPESPPSPAAILGMASALGFDIPWPKIVQFLVCVAEGIWTKPLPQALKDCGIQWGQPTS